MSRTRQHSTDHTPRHVVLLGGPSDIPDNLRQGHAPEHDVKIKILHRGGYEHFERDGYDPAGAEPTSVVYRWTTRTKIAE